MYIWLAPLVCIIGLVLYLLVDPAKYPKLPEVGRIMFWVGLLVSLLLHHEGGPAVTIR